MSLAWGPGRAEPQEPGTITAQSVAGRITFAPRPGRTLLFGRADLDVHVCVGGTDEAVSREQGAITYRNRDSPGLWWVTTTGTLPIRLPSRLLYRDEDAVPLDNGYTPLFIRGTGPREHLLEIYIAGPAGHGPAPRHYDPTQPPRTWRLSRDERLAVIAVGHRYLRHDPHAQPITWHAAARYLAEAQPGRRWTHKKVARLVTDVRYRLRDGGVRGLTEKEVGRPVGNTLNHNLIRELMLSTTIVPPDLAEFDAMFD